MVLKKINIKNIFSLETKKLDEEEKAQARYLRAQASWSSTRADI